MRPEVADSWHRSAAAGVQVGADTTPITLPDDMLRDYREAHPLAEVFPVLDDVLGLAARECDAIMAVSDASGQLLWVCGNPSALRAGEKIGFVEGSNWDERMAGTNAPGMALALDRTATVIGSEHFRQSVRGWSCAATPIHDPASSAILGGLDITGSRDVVGPQAVAMVRAAARLAESELARSMLQRRLERPAAPTDGMRIDIESLGRPESVVAVRDGDRAARSARLSLRHSEILVLLASAPHGLSGDELAVLLYEDANGDSTLRAEMQRFRHLLGDQLVASRPYRLVTTIAADWLMVEALLASGDVPAAMRAYRGPVLPRSTAPGVTRLREELAQSLRVAVLQSRSPELMSTWTRSAWGADDYEMWVAQRRAVGPQHALLPLIDSQIARLDKEFAL